MKKKRREKHPVLAKALATELARNTPQSRMRALEIMRRIKHGRAATGRMNKNVLEVVYPDGSIKRLGGRG